MGVPGRLAWAVLFVLPMALGLLALAALFVPLGWIGRFFAWARS